MTTAGQYIATARGVMLADPKMLGNSLLTSGEALFDPAFWAARGEVNPTAGGRGAAWFIQWRDLHWVLRHSRRGGLLAPLTGDRYWWAGEASVRTFAEWRLLKTLSERGLPVPKPIAAHCMRSGLIYRCDLITERIRHARPFSAALAERPQPQAVWHEVGAVIARLHRAGADHADLNAHNVLRGSDADRGVSISVIDFDRGRLRAAGSWQQGNLARLKRSLTKISQSLPSERFTPREWGWLEAGYGAA